MAQVDVQSLFNADACELYSLTWSEFDESGSGFTNIDNLRPLVERLADNGSDVPPTPGPGDLITPCS